MPLFLIAWFLIQGNTPYAQAHENYTYKRDASQEVWSEETEYRWSGQHIDRCGSTQGVQQFERMCMLVLRWSYRSFFQLWWLHTCMRRHAQSFRSVPDSWQLLTMRVAWRRHNRSLVRVETNRKLKSGTKIQPKEEVFGRIYLRTSGQKLRVRPGTSHPWTNTSVGGQLLKNFQDHWSIRIFPGKGMDQWLVHMNFPRNWYGPMALKVLCKFQSWPVLVHRLRPSKSWKTSILEWTSCTDVHEQNFGLKNFGLIFRSL